MKVRLAFSATIFCCVAHLLTADLGAQMILARYDFEGGWRPASSVAGVSGSDWTTTPSRIDYLGGGGNPGGAAVARAWC